MPDYREIVVGQSGQAFTRILAARIRQPKKIDLSDLKEPDRPALRAAQELVATSGQLPPLEGVDGDVAELSSSSLMWREDLFASVYDREEGKQLLELAIKSKKPVHVLLLGDPASGKSQLLQCCSTLPRTRYAVGGMTTSAGLVDYLTAQPGTQIMLIDEFEKADMADYAALYELMESGQAPVLKHGKQDIVRWRGRVFAAANSAERIPQALRERFVELELPSYTQEQMQSISEQLLEHREGLPAGRAKAIAAAAAARTNDPRKAVQIGRLAGHEGELDSIVERVIPTKRAATR